MNSTSLIIFFFKIEQEMEIAEVLKGLSERMEKAVNSINKYEAAINKAGLLFIYVLLPLFLTLAASPLEAQRST